MESIALRHCGFWFTVVGIFISAFSIITSLYFSWTCLTEFFPGLLTSAMGLHLMHVCRGCNQKSKCSTNDSGRNSPFYYELEPSPPPRALPPVPKDIGRDYDPIVQDKV